MQKYLVRKNSKKGVMCEQYEKRESYTDKYCISSQKYKNKERKRNINIQTHTLYAVHCTFTNIHTNG